MVDAPDQRGRQAILEVHARGKPLGPDVDLNVIARMTPGLVGANLENLLNEAAILTARRNKRAIGMDELMDSIDRVAEGPERKSQILSDEERRIVAYHEAGHAVVRSTLDFAAPVGKISLVSRGQMLGYVKALPEEDDLLPSKAMFEDELAVKLGGRVAEELTFDEITDGASGDLKQVTAIAKAMVTRYGMSEKLGPPATRPRRHKSILGHGTRRTANV